MKKRYWRNLGAVFIAVGLAACGGGGGGSDGIPGTGGSGDSVGNGGGDQNPPTVPIEDTRAGRNYEQVILVPETGDRIFVSVFEPALLEAGQSYPLVLHSHGYGGSRSTSPDAFQQRLIEAGYYVISIDQRGFGESTGTVRVQSPDFEGYDLIAVLDWAENLPGLARRDGKMLVGSYGGSYGGMYQLLLAAADLQHRLRVIAPDITPHDLVYSLYPNEVIKSGWALVLAGAAELPVLSLAAGLAGGADPASLVGDLLARFQRASLRQDAVVYESLIRAALTNRFPEAGRNLFAYHSFRHFCDTRTAGPQTGFVIGDPDPIQDSIFNPGQFPPPIDALITQGFRDTLFNVNEAVENYRCLQGAGGDLLFFTHQSGHILPVSAETAGLGPLVDELARVLRVPEFQSPGGTRTCGDVDLDALTFAWFQAKLQGKPEALQTMLTHGDDICISLAEGDAVFVDQMTVGGQPFDIGMAIAADGVTGVLASLLGSQALDALQLGAESFGPLMNETILAGIPTLSVDIQSLAGPANAECAIDPLPLACDPILFFAIGQRSPGETAWEIVDDQLTPVRGFGAHQLEMVAIAERLAAGDELGLLVFGFHPQYPVTFSRDILVPAVTIQGEVRLPLLPAAP